MYKRKTYKYTGTMAKRLPYKRNNKRKTISGYRKPTLRANPAIRTFVMK